MPEAQNYPGIHVDIDPARSPVLDLLAMDWAKISGKVIGVEDKTAADKLENPGGLWVSLARLLSGGVFPKHQHPYPQVFIFVEGTGEVELDGEVLEARPGLVVRMFHGESHEVRNPGAEPLVLYQISLPNWRPEKDE